MRIININNVKEGDILADNIFDNEGRILLRSGVRIQEGYLKRLLDLGFDALPIKDERLEDVQIDKAISEQTRTAAYQAVRKVTTNLEREDEVNNDNLASMKNAVLKMIEDLISSPGIQGSLTDMRGFDDNTYYHSINTTIISLVMGISFGYKEDKLIELGLGVLLHDIGKLKISKDILNKKGKLSLEEYKEIQKHPLFGFEIIRRNRDISILSAHVALQHQERWDGTGYPRGLKGRDIHEFGRISAVADVYEALTGKRPYRQALQPYQAYEFVTAHSGIHFDPAIVQHFIKKVAIYPTGTGVIMSNGLKGTVIKQNANIPDRPVVRVLVDNEKVLTAPVDYNLAEHPSLIIKEVSNDF